MVKSLGASPRRVKPFDFWGLRWGWIVEVSGIWAGWVGWGGWGWLGRLAGWAGWSGFAELAGLDWAVWGR